MTTRNNAHARAGIDAALAEIGKAAGHTPGPWEYRMCDETGERAIFQAHESNAMLALAYTRAPFPRECDAVQEADARLIAAAPELLAALVELVERAEAEGRIDGLPEYEQAAAAIAKAKGVQS